MLTKLLHGRSVCRAELDRLVSEDTAQPHADHVSVIRYFGLAQSGTRTSVAESCPGAYGLISSTGVPS